MTVTIRDIARKLNLSIGAVSRALDGYPDISEETRQRVSQAAREMGYVPNRAARQLRRRKADTLGFVLPAARPRFGDPFFSELLAGLGDEANRHGFDLLVATAAPGSETEERLYRTWVQGNKVDGIVLARLRLQDWRVRFLAAEHFPFVGLERSLDEVEFPHVMVDNCGSVAALVAHLVECGFERIAYIGGPEELKIQADRQRGYRSGLEAAGLPFRPGFTCTADMTSTGGYEAALGLLALAEPPDAFVCINDETAFGVLHAAHQKGLAVGRDLGVAGFDGVQEAAHSQPPLTTIDQPVYEIARLLVQILVQRIKEGAGEKIVHPVPLALLKRASTCEPGKGAG